MKVHTILIAIKFESVVKSTLLAILYLSHLSYSPNFNFFGVL